MDRWRKLFLCACVLLVAGSAGAVSVDRFEYTVAGANGSVEYLEPNDTLEFELNATNSTNATLRVTTESGATSDYYMELVSSGSTGSGTFQYYEYNYTVPSGREPGDWSFTGIAENETALTADQEEISEEVAMDQPHVLSLNEDPSYVRKGSNTTITADVLDSEGNVSGNLTLNEETDSMTLVESEDPYYSFEANVSSNQSGTNLYEVNISDEGGRYDTATGSFTVYDTLQNTEVTVKVAPDCSSQLDFFLLPGDGEIVRNKTGIFVEIISNSGNVESNITVEYLDVWFEDQNPYSRGELKGNGNESETLIEEYAGEKYSNILITEAITYFKLFNANYQLGNYSAHSEITSECQEAGPKNESVDKEEINETYNCDSLSGNFSCFRVTTVSQSYVAAEVDSTNLTDGGPNVSSVESDDPRQGNITLNDTELDAYVYNSSSTLGYDYACLTDNSTVEEDVECDYEGERIPEYTTEVTDIDYDADNATFTRQERQPDLLNTTLDCESVDNETALCDYTLKFFEQFKIFGNFEIVTAIGETGGVNQTGNQSTNQTVPEDINQTGNQSTNETVPDPDRPEPGNSPQPGQTPEPEPRPEPRPEPDPVVRVDLNSLQERYTARKGQFVAATFNVSNIGNTDLEDVNLIPQTDQIYPSWNYRAASVTELSVNETVQREVFIQPSNSTATGEYVVPVEASTDGEQLDLDYFELKVLPTIFEPEVRIQEAPGSVNLRVNSSRSIPVLVRNTGKTNLSEVSANLQNFEDCGSYTMDSVTSLRINDSSTLRLNLETGSRSQQCNTTLVVSTGGGAYAFSNIEFTVEPEPGLIPEDQRVPLIAILWTALLGAYSWATRRFDLDSLAVKGPFVGIIAGEILIILYIASTELGYNLSAVLPF